MKYLLDTCIVSETRKKNPDPGVIGWLSNIEAETLFISAITVGEIASGIKKLKSTQKAKALARWLNELRNVFQSRILSVDATVAECWGEILADCSRQGRPRPAVDALIAAMARVENLVLVTRNVKDMEGMGVKILNPFSD